MRAKFPPSSRDRRDRPATHPLTDQQIFRASTLWEEQGKSLGEIAQEVGCSVYQLGFLYRELLPHVRRVDITPLVVGREPTPVKYKLPAHNSSMFAVGFRKNKDYTVNNLLPGFDAGPAILKDLLDHTPRDTPENTTPVIVRLTDPPQVVAVWDRDHLCWVVTAKKRG